jgi:hypothetical protein
MSIRAITVGIPGAILATASSPGAQVLDHLKCYKVKDALKVAGTVDADGLQFGLDPGCKVSKAKLVCVPASDTNVAVQDKLSGPITPLPVSGPALESDQVCYKLKCPAGDRGARVRYRAFRELPKIIATIGSVRARRRR